MSRYRARLPQLDGGLYLSDGGLETTLIFHEGWDLPCFASFPLMQTEKGRKALLRYCEKYIAIAIKSNAGFILETPTWRANPDWGAKLGYDLTGLAEINRASVAMLEEIRARHETPTSPMPISGCIGPRGDGYNPGEIMSADEAEAYHAWQIGVFRDTAADFVSAYTLTNINEGIGFARAAKAAEMPCVVSFTLETDGRLPSSETLGQAIEAVELASDLWPAYYMINCAHPTHFSHVLDPEAPWMPRLKGIRANSSSRSHAELDRAPDLDIGNPAELGGQYADIRRRFPHITVLGGCCGTDHRHVECIGEACLKAA